MASTGWDYDVTDMPESYEGFDSLGEGGYHVSVVHVDEDGGKNGEMIVDFECLAGTVPNCEGKTHREYFSKPSKDQDRQKRANTIKRAMLFAISTGLTTVEEIEKNKKSGKATIPQFRMAVGRQMKLRLSKSEYNGKTNYKAGFDLFGLDDPKGAEIPTNKGMAAKNGDAQADPFKDAF